MKSECMQYKEFTGSIEVSLEDDCLHGRILFIDDLVTYEAEKPSDLVVSFHDAVDRYIVDCEETGKPANKPYSGSFNIRIGEKLHKQAYQSAIRSGIKLNEFVKNAVRQAVTMEGGIQINHHHEHDVKVTLQNKGSEPLELVATTSEPPRDWQPIAQTRH